MDLLKCDLYAVRERLLNSLSTATVLVLFYCGPLYGILFSLYLVCTPLLPLVLLYFLWMYIDKNTPHQAGRRSKWIRSLPIFQRFRNYFPQILIKTAELSPEKNYILCAFPHGILCTSILSQFLSENKEFETLFPGIDVTCHTLNLNFYFPFSREFVLSIGFHSVSKEALVYQLTKPRGHAVCLVVGGSAEAMICTPGKHRVVVQNRKGFVKLALTTGSDLVPMYSFGESEIYNHWMLPENSIGRKIQEAVRKLTGVAPVLATGRGIFQNAFGLLPFSKQITLVVGKPIPVEKVEKPTREQINSLHQQFIQELVNLFEEHKHKYIVSPESVHLSIEE